MKRLSIDDLKELFENDEDFAVVDVRDAQAYAEWHIPGAISAPVMASLRVDDPRPLQQLAPSLPSDMPLVVVCNRGNSSQKATRILEDMGFNAASLDGGMLGYSLVTSEADVEISSACAGCIQIRRNGKGCLSYFLHSAGEAVVIDPCVDVEAYIDISVESMAQIVKVIETHVHADHVSRARELCERTGAKLCIPRNNRVTFDYHPIDHGDVIEFGEIELIAIATPGHTAESTCYQFYDELLFTGDSIFVDSVGRPDLERGDAGAESAARALYRSLHERVMVLPDEMTICPGHTLPGIAFDEQPIVARLGDIKRSLGLLRSDEASFVKQTLAGIGPKPPSFATIISINEGKMNLGGEDPAALEAGPNRCAVAAGAVSRAGLPR